MFLYNYDVTYLDEYGDRVNGTLQLSVPKAPVYESLTIDDYNEFVAYYNKLIDESSGDAEAKLQPLADDLYLGNEGDPFGYYRDDVSSELPSLNRYGKLKNLTASSGSNSVEYSITKSESEEVEIAHGFSFELSVMGGFGIGGASAKAGGYVSLDYMRGHSVSKSHGEGTAFGGTVMGLDGKAMREDGLDPNAWGFNWQLATWDSNLKDNTENSKGYVPVIGYVLSGVQAPPMPVENLNVQFTRPTDVDELYFDLAWDCGDIDGTGRTKTAGYRVYLYDFIEETFKLVTTINDPQTTTYRYQKTFDGREYYHFMVTAFSEATTTAGSLESVPRYTTYYMSTADGAVLKIEKTGTDGLVDTYTIYFFDGTTQTFTVKNGNGIKTIGLLNSDPETRTDTYLITFVDGSNTTFTIKNGTDGEKGDRGEKGEDGIGIDRIEKLRSVGDTDIYAVHLTDGTFYTFTVTNGKDSADGKDGLDGKDGKDGMTPILKIGTDNLWYVSYDNGVTWTSLGANATGDTGASGTDGKDGNTPYIGNNGNWWIGDVDTGVNATGNKGEKGDKGDTGAQGEKGDTGASGNDGKDGKDGVGIKDCKVNDSGDLIVTLTDGSTINAGSVLASTAANAQVDDNSTNVSTPLTIAAIGISSASLLWNIVTLIIAILRKKNRGASI